jgi:hypothetical protein
MCLSSVLVKQSTVCKFNSGDSWVILSEIEQRIKKKIERVGTPLEKWDIQINYGIKTGCNEAFIIDGTTKKELIRQDTKSAEIIRPILRGRDIRRYGYDFADLWLLFIPWHFPLHNDQSIQGASKKAEQAFKKQYPAIYNHLSQYKEVLSNRNKSETGIRYEWYALQRWGANYWEDFYRQKIVWASVGETYYSFVPKGTFLLDTNYFFSTDENFEFLLAVLNSKLITFWINTEDTQIGDGGAFRHYKYNLERLNIPKPTIKIELSVKKLLQKKDYQGIDELVYELYNLSTEEIKFIENFL